MQKMFTCMSEDISRKDVVQNAGNADDSPLKDVDDEQPRRGFLRGSAAVGLAALGSVFGISTASAKEDGRPKLQEKSVDVTTVHKVLEEKGNELLANLADDGLISNASVSALPAHSEFDNAPGGVGRYRVGDQKYDQFTITKITDGGRLMLNIPDEGAPLAVFAPTGEKKRVYYTVGTDFQGETKDVSTASCGGCSCTQAPLCVLKNFRKTVCEVTDNGTCKTVTSCGC